MPSKQVTQRQRTARVVEAAVHTHGADAAQALQAKLQLPPEEVEGTAARARELLRTLTAHLAQARERLVTADEAHITELGNDRAPRRRRDVLVRALYRKVVDLRAAVETTFGPGSSKELLDVEGITSRDPVVLHRQGRRMLEYFSDPAKVWPAARYPGLGLDPAAFAETLRPEVEALGAALDDVAEDRHQAETTLAEKNEAMEAFDRIYQAVARIAEGTFSLAGLDTQAARVKPGRRRASQGAGGAGGDAAGEQEPGPTPTAEDASTPQSGAQGGPSPLKLAAQAVQPAAAPPRAPAVVPAPVKPPLGIPAAFVPIASPFAGPLSTADPAAPASPPPLASL